MNQREGKIKTQYLVISIGKKKKKKKTSLFATAPIRLLRECKLTSPVNICDSVPPGRGRQISDECRACLYSKTESTKLMVTTDCLNTSPPVTLPRGWKWFVILAASLRKIHRNELR